MADDTVEIDINVNTDDSVKSMKQMRAEYKALLQQMDEAAAKDDKQTFNKLKQSLGELKNDMKDLRQEMNLMDPDEMLSGFIKMAQGAVGSFAAITGAMQLFGSESEAVQEIQKKSMALIQTMMGLEQIRQMLFDKGNKAQIKATMDAIKLAAAKILMTKSEIVALEGATAAQKALNIAQKANQFGLMLAAITAIIAAIASMVKQQNDYEKRLKQSTKATEAFVGWQKQLVEIQKTATEGALKERAGLDVLFEKAKTSIGNKQLYATAINEINKQYGKYLPNLLTEKSSLDDLSIAYDILIKKMEERLQAEVALETAKSSLIARENAKLAIKEIQRQQQVMDEFQKWINAKNKPESYMYFTEFNRIIKENGISYKQYMETLSGGQTVLTLLNNKLMTLREEYDRTNLAYNEAIVSAASFQIAMTDNTTATGKGTKAAKEYNKELERTIELEKEFAVAPPRFTFDPESIKLYYKLRAENEALSEKERVAALINLEEIRYNEELALAGEYGPAREEVERRHQMNLLKIRNEGLDATKDAEEKFKKWSEMNDLERVDRLREYVDLIGDYARQTTDVILAYQKQSVENQMIEINKLYEQSQSEYDRLLKENLISQEEFDRLSAINQEEKTRKENDQKRKAFNQEKTAQITNATIQTLMAVLNAYSSGMAYPMIGPATAAIFAAAAGIFGAAQIGLIAGEKNPYARGGLITGKPHAQGGEDINVEGGEVVLNKKAMAIPQYRMLANAMNTSTGGALIPMAGMNTGAAAGTSVEASIPDSVIEKIVNKIAAIPVVVTERDITRTQRKVAVIEKRVTI